MENLYDFNELFNTYLEIFNQIKDIPKSSVNNISNIIQKKIQTLGQKSLEVWLSNKIGTGRTETHLKKSDPNNGIETEYHYHGLVEKTYTTVLGNISLNRAYYYNKEKKSGFFPVEEKYVFLKDSCFPEVKEYICYTSCIEPFGQAQEVLEKLSKIKVSTSEIQKITKEIGGELVLQEEKLLENQAKYIESKKSIDKLIVSMDGAMINTYEGWKEVKSGVIYEIKEEKEILKSINKSYISRIEDCNIFSNRLKEEARRRHYLEAKEVIVIGDGARWIWDLSEKELPKSIQIVDWYHAKGHLYNIIELLYDDKNRPEAVIFGKECSDLLYAGDIKALEDKIKNKMRELNIFEGIDTLIKIQTEIEYFIKNRNRMKYEYFESRKYPIGSGIIEATCKQLVQLRLKRNGMRWKKEGAHNILQLRCHYLGNRWDEVKSIIWKKAA